MARSIRGAAVRSNREIVCDAKRPPSIGVAPQQQFVDRIVGESVSVIAIGMATRDREDTLRDQIAHPVRHGPRRARVGEPDYRDNSVRNRGLENTLIRLPNTSVGGQPPRVYRGAIRGAIREG